MGLRKSIKRIGRKALKVHAKVTKVIAPVVSAAATVFAGPAGGAAVTALMGTSARYAAAAGARGDGKKGHDARVVGRSARARTVKYGLIGTGVGAVTAGAIGGLGAAVAGLGGQSVLGLGSGSGIGGLSNPLMAAGATAAAGKAGGSSDSTPYTLADLENGRAPSSGGNPIDGLVAGLPGIWNTLTGREEKGKPQSWVVPALIVGGVLLLMNAA